MENRRRERPPFASRQSRVERILALVWLPIHLFLLPRLIVLLFPAIGDSWLNFAVYGTGTVCMLVTQFRFLRRDFDPLCDRPGYVLLEILVSYGAMLLFNMAVSGLLLLVSHGLDNPNNAAVISMAQTQSGPIAAMAVFLAPIVEEVMFRAGTIPWPGSMPCSICRWAICSAGSMSGRTASGAASCCICS